MQVGDLVKYESLCGGNWHLGIIVDFNEIDNPMIFENKTGIVAASWRDAVEVINASR